MPSIMTTVSKTLAYIVIAIILATAGFYVFNSYIYNEKQGGAAKSYKDAAYVIEGRMIKLKNGLSEIPLENSTTKIVTRYFGNEVTEDLDNDGREDTVFLITQETGGSGAFYYVVAALNTENGYTGSHALLLGDRIAPQTTQMSRDPNHVNVIVVNYADRAAGESFTTPPSIGKSIWLKLDPETMQFGEVEQNFPGEADPNKMTLGMKKWNWISALYNDGQGVKPNQSDKFSVTFGPDGKFTATTDCNSMGGTYKTDGDKITFSEIYSTKMYCENSQENDFAKLLSDTSGYHFTSRGELILDLKMDSGSVVFR